MKKYKSIVVSCIFLSLLLASCSKNATEDKLDSREGQESTKSEVTEDAKDEEKEDKKDDSNEQADLSEDGVKKGDQIKDQSFDVNLNPLGEVTFASYNPDTSGNPLADVVFQIEKEGSVLQALDGTFDTNIRANEMFEQVEAVSFPDYNEDGLDDIITICSYSFASGPDAASGNSEIRYYSGNDDGTFTLDQKLTEDANEAISEKTIRSAKEFAAGKSDSGNTDTSKANTVSAWQQAYIDYLKHDTVVEAQQGYSYLYLDDDEIPELVEIGMDEATGCRIVHYANGKANVTQLNRLYFTYIEKSGLLCNSEGNMDHYYDLVYCLKDGELVLVAEGAYGAEDNSNVQFDKNGDPIYQYEWEGESVTKEEYDQALNQVYDTTKAKDGYVWDEWYSCDEMISLLESGELD